MLALAGLALAQTTTTVTGSYVVLTGANQDAEGTFTPIKPFTLAGPFQVVGNAIKRKITNGKMGVPLVPTDQATPSGEYYFLDRVIYKYTTPPAPGGRTPGQGYDAITIHGTSVPVNSASDQLLGTVAPTVGSWLSLVDCKSNGRVLRYVTAKHTVSCRSLASADTPASIVQGASSFTTPGAIPKVSPAGTLPESAISDNGTDTVTVTGRNPAIANALIMDSGNYASFALACSAASAAHATLAVSRSWTGPTTHTSPARFKFYLATRAVLQPANGQTLTLSPFDGDAPLAQIFDTFLGGTVVLSRVTELRPEWSGAKCDWNGSTGIDDLPAFKAALSNGGQVWMPPRSRHLSDSWVISKSVTILGLGAFWGSSPSKLVFAAAKSGLVIGYGTSSGSVNANWGHIQNVYLTSPSTVAGSDNGLKVRTAGMWIERVCADTFGNDAFAIDSTVGTNTNNNLSHCTHCITAGNRRHGFFVQGSDSQALMFDHVYAEGNKGWKFYVIGGGRRVFNAPLSDFGGLGGYYDAGGTTQCNWPCSEGDPGPAAVIAGRYQVREMGNYGAPDVRDNGGPSNRMYRDGVFENIAVSHEGNDVTAFTVDGSAAFHHSGTAQGTGLTQVVVREGLHNLDLGMCLLEDSSGGMLGEYVHGSGGDVRQVLGGSGASGSILWNSPTETVGYAGISPLYVPEGSLADVALGAAHDLVLFNGATKHAIIRSDGGFRLFSVTSPSCDAAHEGAQYYVSGTAAIKQVCARTACGIYALQTMMATDSSQALAQTPLTARDDLLVANTATPVLGKLAKGTQYQALPGKSTDPGYDAACLDQAMAIAGILPAGNLPAALSSTTSVNGTSIPSGAVLASAATGGSLTASGAYSVTLTATAATTAALPAGTKTLMATNTTVAGSHLPAQYRVRSCTIGIGDPGAASPVLADDNDAPVACANEFGSDWRITTVTCWANAGSPMVTPILTGETATSTLTGALTCGTASWAAGTVQSTAPVVHSFSGPGATCSSTPCTVDVNITSAGSVAKYLVRKITGTI